ncbi:MAG: anion permease [Acidobacteria bacterium]|nr:anion permease [Acidobacteriota bacterium]
MKVEEITVKTAIWARDWNWLHLVAGPAVFVVMLLIPIDSMAYPIRCSLGLLIWMAWWWISRAVDLAVTGFLPLIVVALFNFVPVATVLGAYAQDLIILLLGANLLTTTWARWGLDRRIALGSLIGVGTNTTRQIVVWFVISLVLSAFLPNTIVAAAMIPIVIAMLRYIGIEDLWNSNLGTALVLAIAWGTSVGGFATPLGGAPNLLTIKFVQDTVTHHEFLFMTWVTRFLPLTIALIICSVVYMRFAFKPEMKELQGTRSYFVEEMRKLGSMSIPERWGLFLFGFATVLAFTRQFYASRLPALSPAYVFLACGVLCLIIRHQGQPLIDWGYAQSKMMWGLFYLFAGGTALGEILSQTGTAKFLAEILVPFASGGGFAAVAVFAILTMVVTQITSNTAAIAITVPIAITTFQSLNMNPIPFVYIVTAVGNCGFVLPSSAGGPAVAAGYGINLKTMLVKGFWLSLIALAVLLFGGYILAVFWSGFGVA